MKHRAWLEAELGEQGTLLLADGMEDAFLGVGWQFTHPIAVYDRETCLAILMREMSREEAEEFFAFNVAGAYVGDQTPIFLSRPPKERVS